MTLEHPLAPLVVSIYPASAHAASALKCLGAASALLFICALPLREASASCEVIPGVKSQFRSALGTVNRPFAIPGDDGEQIEIALDSGGCAAASPGFGGPGLEDDFFVTVLFEPPNGPRNAVVLTTAASESDCQDLLTPAALSLLGPDGGASCRVVAGGSQLEVVDAQHLRFRFPDTDDLLSPNGDDLTLTGPTTVAVTAIGADLPFALASGRCADTVGLVACVDEFYALDGTCQTSASHLDPVFPGFTALPPANDYQALCTPPGPCSDSANELRFSLDTAGNALVPMDYRGVLVASNTIPVPRLLLGSTQLEAFEGGGVPVDLPDDSYLGAFSTGGHRLPPILAPVQDPDTPGEVSIFGSVDASVGVLRVQRRGCDAGSGSLEGATCTSDLQCGGGTCLTLFDFSTRLAQDGAGHAVGPVLIADAEFDLEARNPVPLDGLLSSDDVFAFVAAESIEGISLNDDSDYDDPVLRLRNRTTAEILPIGSNDTDGRAVTRVRQGEFRYPAVAVEGDVVAFLELEPLEGEAGVQDKNQNNSAFDPILRIYRADEQAGLATPLLPDDDPAAAIAVDAAPLVAERSLVVSNGFVYFRTPEGRNAHQVTRRVSVDSSGNEADNHSRAVVLSADGQIAAFSSDASNLVDDNSAGGWDTNLREDIFVHELSMDMEQNGTTERVSLASDESESEGNVQFVAGPRISADGQIVAFTSTAGDLVPGDSGGHKDVFVRDRATTETRRVNLRNDGNQVPNPSHHVSLSADGGVVAFESGGDITSIGDPMYEFQQIFVRGHADPLPPADLVSVVTDPPNPEEPAQLNTDKPALSGTGEVVVFLSRWDLVENEASSCQDPPCWETFVHERSTDQTTYVAHIDDPAYRYNHKEPTISADGNAIAFASNSPIYVAGDTNSAGDIFVYTRDTGKIERVSVSSIGEQQEGDQQTGGNANRPALSKNGRFVAFNSDASNLVPGDTNGSDDVFVHDRTTGAVDRVTVSTAGSEANLGGGRASISLDGLYVGFESDSDDLLPPNEDANMSRDVFVRGPAYDPADDYSGDGDVSDTVLQVFDTAGSQLTALCPAEEVAVASGRAAFLRPEAAGDATGCPTGVSLSLNGDADAGDSVVHFYAPGEAVVNLGLAATAVSLSEQWLAVLVSESQQGNADRNGDLDTLDRVLAVSDVSGSAPGPWVDVGDAADSVSVVGPFVAYLVPEPDQGGQDLNGDGDQKDRVLHVLDLRSGAPGSVVNVGQAAEEFVLGSNLVAFRTNETSQGVDLNVDGDMDDDVLQVYDFVSGQTFSSQQQVKRCGFEGCDPRLPYRVAGDVVHFITAECAQGGPENTGCPGGGTDLNGDGDAADLVKQVFNVREAATQAAESANATLLLALGGIGAGAGALPAAAGIEAVARVVRGICTDSGKACAESSDCTSGTCFLPPGACIADLGGATCPENSCSSDEFCSATTQTCHKNQGPCATSADCSGFSPPGECVDTAADVQRLFSPVAALDDAGEQALFSSGICLEDIFGASIACTSDAQCPSGTSCGMGGTCEGLRRHGSCLKQADCEAGATCTDSLVVVGAADTDGDGIADPYDNCALRANTDQADFDGDGVGNVCACGNDVFEAAFEECDDGNARSFDGCSSRCLDEFVWEFSGTARGGSIEIVVQGVTLELVTSAGQSAQQVAAGLAALINSDPTLAALGVRAEFSGTLAATDGYVTSIFIDDPGLAPVLIPAVGQSALLVLAALLGIAGAKTIRRLAGRSRLIR